MTELEVQGRRRGPYQQGRHRVCLRPLHRSDRRSAALHRAGKRIPEGRLHRRHAVRWFLRGRLPGHQRVRYEAGAGRFHRIRRSVPQAQDPRRGLLHRRPADRRAVLPRSASGCRQGRGLPEVHRHRRHRFLRSGSRVLHLRQGALREQHAALLLRGRLHRSSVELRRRHRRRRHPEHRIQEPRQAAATSRFRRSTTPRICATTWSPTCRRSA